MSYKELIPEGEYREIVARDEARAQAMIDLLFAAEKTDPRVKFMNIRPMVTIKRMFEESAALWPDRPAFWEKPSRKEPYRMIPYTEALARVNALGTGLHGRGMRGAHIAVMGDNSYAWATAYLAIVGGTGVVVPLDKELPKAEIEQLLEIGDVEAIFYHKKYAPMMEEIRAGGKTKLSLFVNNGDRVGGVTDDLRDFEVSADTIVAEGQKLLDEGNRDFLDAQIDAERLGILLFTAGTTGFAKGVMLSHKNICAEMMIPTVVIGIVPTDVFFSVLPIHHTYEGTCGFLIPLAQGASIAYCEGLRHIVENLSEAHPTIFLGVPLLFENLYKKIWQNIEKQGKTKLVQSVMKVNHGTRKIGLDLGNIFFKQIRALFGGQMRLLICGGAAIDPAVVDGIKEFGINTVQGYGLTECSPIAALNPIFGGNSASAGYLVPGFDAKITEADPETGIGEICLKGEHVMMGYYKNEEATSEVMEDGWFHTGDYGYVDKDRFVFITGRKKNVIITKNGKNVYPEELEYLLARHGIIGELMVWEASSAKDDDTIIAVTVVPDAEYVEANLGAGATDEALGKALWEAVDAVNAEQPIFKKIRKVYLRKEPFDITTKKTIRRFNQDNRAGIEV
ncbi:MAG: AMP-binding protein [Clostridiales Family XIII bacterium]|jgi:long-chain acyl-CoA synthetase|nr:AMP-binding protein [Clostridiales Family XIII bacterium]